MTFPNIFTSEVVTPVIDRINKLTPASKPNWGKMDAAQMFAHCNVAYEMAYENKHPKPGFLVRLLLKAFVQNTVTGPAPYKRNSRTGPQFLITEPKDFELEKTRLIGYINKTKQLGEDHFEGRESLSFGTLNKDQWNTMFYKHLDHHLTQFGV